MKKGKDTITLVIRVKVFLADEDKNSRDEKYKLLRQMAWEGRHIRNDAMRQCVVYWQSKKDGIDLGTRPNGKDMDYRTFIRAHRRELKYLNENAANNTERQVYQKFQREWKQILSAQRSIPLFRDSSIYIQGITPATDSRPAVGSEIFARGDEYFFQPFGLKRAGLLFGIVKGGKSWRVKGVLDNIIAGAYKFSDSQLIQGRDGAWYLHLAYTRPVEEKKPDSGRICGVSVSFPVPLCAMLNDETVAFELGDARKLLKFKAQIRARRHSLQTHRNDMKRGHGKKRAMKAHDHIAEVEANFVKSYNHTMSRRIVEFCRKLKVPTIHLLNLTKDVKLDDQFLRENWTYYQLHSQIEYKARMAGIKVNYVDPKDIHTTCRICGNTDAGNIQPPEVFLCTACGHKANVYENAALNVALSTNIIERTVESEEDAL